MSNKNFVSAGNAESIFASYANRIDLSPTAFVGTEEEWNALSELKKSKYSLVNITNDGGNDVTVVSDTTSVSGVSCYRNGAVKQITFSGCTAAAIPNGFRPTANKYLGLAFDDSSKNPVLIYAESDGTVTVQEIGTADVLTTYSLYGTFTYMY